VDFKFNELRDEIETLEYKLIDAGVCTSFLMNIKMVYFKMYLKHMRKKLTGRSQGGGRIHESAIRN